MLNTSSQKLDSKKEKEIFINAFAARFQELWKSNEYSDFTITAGSLDNLKKFKVHKCVLGTQSSILAAVFNNKMKESIESDMVIKDFSVECVEDFLYFLYSGELRDEKNAMELFAIASKYDVGQLKTIAENIVLNNIDCLNAIEVFGLGHLHESEKLQTAAFNEIKKMFPELKLNDYLIKTPEKLEKLVEARRNLDRKKTAAEDEYKVKLQDLKL